MKKVESITLADIHQNYPTDKGTGHNYINAYDKLFAPYQHKKINFMEVGILLGGSLEMWNEYFPKANLYGVDDFSQVHTNSDFGGIDVSHDIVVDKLSKYDRITFIEPVNARNNDIVKDKIGSLSIEFDIIIDDGDHNPTSQLEVFDNFVPYLSKTGVYVIEDVCGVAQANHIKNSINQKYNPIGWYPEIEIMPFNIHQRPDDILVVIK